MNELTLEEMMQRMNRHVFVRFDPERERNKFTVMVSGVARRDTDEPRDYLKRWLLECCGKPVLYTCLCGLNYHCTVCGMGQGGSPCDCLPETQSSPYEAE